MPTPPLTPREFAYVRVTGPGSHEAVSKCMGIQPSEAWNVGDINPRTGQPRKSMQWVLKSGLDDSRPLSEHISSLFVWFGRPIIDIRKLWLDYDLELVCVGYYPASVGSGMGFDREVVRKAAQLGMSIDIDHYFVEDHDHDG